MAASATMLSCMIAQPAAAQELSYRLPDGAAFAGYSARITQCPDANGENTQIVHGPAIRGSYAPGPHVRLNANSSFLASKSIALEYFEDGTLKTINSESAGTGGEVLAAILKVAAGMVGLKSSLFDAPAQCTAKIESLVAERQNAAESIAGLEAQLARGDVLSAQAKALYEGNTARLVEIDKALTITVSKKFAPTGPSDLPNGSRSALGQLKIEDWFDGGNVPAVTGLPAEVCVSAKLGDDARAQIARGGTANPPFDANLRQDRFIYRTPLPLQVTVYTGDNCDAAEPVKTASVLIPQLSPFQALPISAKVLGKKSLSAEFTKEGRLVKIKYAEGGAGSDVAAALTGALAAAETLRDAETASLAREVARIKAQNELDALREAADGDGG